MADYGRVTEQHDRIAIVCSGSSLSGFDFNRLDGLTVIAVNTASRHVRHDYFFTLDPYRETADALRASKGKRYVAFRKILGFPGVTWLKTLFGKGWRGSYMGLAHDPGEIANGNSGHGALNLAMHMKPKAVCILGLDAKPNGYFWGGPIDPFFDHLPELFAAELPPFPVFNGSPDSRVECFPRMTPEEAVERLWGV